MKTLKILVCTLLILLCCDSCKLASIKYSMTGASISPDVKTYSVDYFPNRALLVVPYLSTLFREKLTEYLRTKTSLKEMTDNNGDIRFEGEIVGYYQKPIDIQRDEIASSNRLTIEIRVKYTNTKDDKYDFDSRFSNYTDYSIDIDFDSAEEGLITTILDKIIEDIYNKALVNW
ncbi:LptE family protein [uncultured Odoribacter sp.]|uniref:LptE family protein n=1 Tax=uncultured Odoribacter sp. TaxID=876416 RepID=UPI00260877BC|nr:LptE family protein [uncultured Odoribacter sp.]